MKYIKSLLIIILSLSASSQLLFASNLSGPVFASSLRDLARCYNYAGIIEFFKKYGTDKINSQDDVGSTPLHYVGDRVDIGKLLMSGAQTSFYYTNVYTEGTPLEIATLLLNKGAQASIYTFNAFGMTPLHRVCAQNKESIKVIDLLLKNGAKSLINTPEKDGNTPLHIACQCNVYIEKISCLLENGATSSINTPNKNGVTPFHYALMNGGVDIARFLLEKGATGIGATVGASKMTTLCYLCKCNDEHCNDQMIDFILQNGGNLSINTPNAEGYTPLYYVCYNVRYNTCYKSDLELAALLLKKGASGSVNLQDKEFLNTPLHFACGGVKPDDYRIQLVALLLKNGADATIKNKKGEAPIDIICSNKWTINQRIDLLKHLVPIKITLPEIIKIFIAEIFEDLAKRMQNGQKDMMTFFWRLMNNEIKFDKFTNSLEDVSFQNIILLAEEASKVMASTVFWLFANRESKSFIWPIKDINLDKNNSNNNKTICRFDFTNDSLFQFRSEFLFNIKNYDQYLFIKNLLKFTQNSNKLYKSIKDNQSSEVKQSQQKISSELSYHSRLHDIYFWFDIDLFNKFKKIQQKKELALRCKQSIDPENIKRLINFVSNKAKNEFFDKLLNFTKAANKLYKNTETIEIMQNKKKDAIEIVRCKRLDDIHFRFNLELYKQVIHKKAEIKDKKPIVIGKESKKLEVNPKHTCICN